MLWLQETDTQGDFFSISLHLLSLSIRLANLLTSLLSDSPQPTAYACISSYSSFVFSIFVARFASRTCELIVTCLFVVTLLTTRHWLATGSRCLPIGRRRLLLLLSVVVIVVLLIVIVRGVCLGAAYLVTTMALSCSRSIVLLLSRCCLSVVLIHRCLAIACLVAIVLSVILAVVSLSSSWSCSCCSRALAISLRFSRHRL